MQQVWHLLVCVAGVAFTAVKTSSGLVGDTLINLRFNNCNFDHVKILSQNSGICYNFYVFTKFGAFNFSYFMVIVVTFTRNVISINKSSYFLVIFNKSSCSRTILLSSSANGVWTWWNLKASSTLFPAYLLCNVFIKRYIHMAIRL